MSIHSKLPFSGTTHMVFGQAQLRTPIEDFDKFPTPWCTTVFIWEPFNGIGHVSIAIGNQKIHTKPMWYEQTDTYASWFPGGEGADGLGVLPGRMYEHSSTTFEDDCSSEGCSDKTPGKPEHIIQLWRLSEPAMMAEWTKIRDKPYAHYRLLRKNCSTIVARILRAGMTGLTVWNQAAAQAWAHRIYWTPTDCVKFATVLKSMR